MRAVALLTTLSLTAGACFPGNPRAQTYAKITEGTFVVAGVAMLAFTNTGADCDAHGIPGEPDSNCHNRATALGDLGLGLILAGLVGFIATVSTSDDDKKPAPTAAPPPNPNKAPAPAPAPAPAEPTVTTPPPAEPTPPPAT